ncbi:Integral membrane protein OS=Streptomyces alboniger OX=132473 GN=CP975_14945 PE=4 SV=1 [Streptomyces alboniger]
MNIPWHTLRPAAAGALRRLRAHLWPARHVEQPRNRVYLRERMVTLPLLAVVASLAFGWAYGEIRADSAALHRSHTPALGGLADAEMSLRIADREAGRSLSAGKSVRLSGIGRRYLTRTTRATQNLNQVARSGALTTAERQELDVVSGLVVDYGNWITFAQHNADDPVLRGTGLSYARDMLCTAPTPVRTTTLDGFPPCEPGTGSDATSVVGRISALESSLRGRVEERASLGAGVSVAAVTAAACLVLLAVGLWRTQLFLHHRFHLRFSLPLAAAALPLLTVPFLTADAVLAQCAQQRAVTAVGKLSDRTSPAVESRAEEHPYDRPDPHLIGTLESGARHDLATGRLRALTGAAPWVAPTGLLCGVLIYATLHGYRREYVHIARPGAAS